MDAAAKEASKAAAETVSQLIAKILNQLSLSAWLPSAALVLIVASILQLGTQLEPGRNAGEVLSLAIQEIGSTSIAGVILLSLVIVVSTMVTQAFTFESIRLLEGYWGPGRRIDKLAAVRCRRHETRRAALEERYRELVTAAWADVESSLRDQKPKFTRRMTDKLRERVTGEISQRALGDHQSQRVHDFDWEAHVGVDVLRQLRSVELRLADYPQDPSRIMPTRLGNVLRRYEVDTGADDIEGFVERVYRALPFSLQLSHDEQRARLDLYCSMVFVLWFCALVALARFGWWAWPYTLALVAATSLSSFIAYRAAVASGRYYGTLLVTIAALVEDDESEK